MSKEKENPVIKIDNLVKEYKMFTRKKDRLLEALFPFYEKHQMFRAMDNLNLEIHKGEVVGIMGKNGAGKSTLLKMITGVVCPTSGKIEINGKISSLLELGAAFNGELTGIENIYQHGQVMGLTEQQIEERKQDIIDFADIGDHLYQPVKTYSSGMFARLAFACAINVDPDILIVDEVLSVGDMAFQLKCFKKFEQFKDKGKTILFVTHNVADILKNCNRAVVIEKGRKIFDGDVKTGVEKYKKIIVGINPEEEMDTSNFPETPTKIDDAETWKERMEENPKLINYGNGKAEVIDYGVFDSEGNLVNVIDNDEVVTMKSKVLFKDTVKDPIFTMTVKDFQGKEMAGTNSDVEKVVTGEFHKGDIAIAEFTQKIPIAPGKYTLSFSCTHFNLKGELEALNRKYDALLIEVSTMKNTVGMVRINSQVKVHRLEK
ncbi:MAG: ABC transporter ATP-binding protein [Clostridia bacterium]|nr:ABC transporter ATP-binding protein [Clostridia bacterium]